MTYIDLDLFDENFALELADLREVTFVLIKNLSSAMCYFISKTQ